MSKRIRFRGASACGAPRMPEARLRISPTRHRTKDLLTLRSRLADQVVNHARPAHGAAPRRGQLNDDCHAGGTRSQPEHWMTTGQYHTTRRRPSTYPRKSPY